MFYGMSELKKKIQGKTSGERGKIDEIDFIDAIKWLYASYPYIILFRKIYLISLKYENSNSLKILNAKFFIFPIHISTI